MADQLPRLGKRELICLLSFTCSYVVSVRRGFLFLWVLGVGCVILLWHSLGLPYNFFEFSDEVGRIKACTATEPYFRFPLSDKYMLQIISNSLNVGKFSCKVEQ